MGSARCCAEQRKIDRIASDPRPCPAAGLALREKPHATSNLAHAECPEHCRVMTDTDHLAEQARCENFGQPQTDAEPSQHPRELRVVQIERLAQRTGALHPASMTLITSIASTAAPCGSRRTPF